MARKALAEEIAVVRDLSLKLGLGEVEPTLLKRAHHSTFAIARLAIVARVQSSEMLETALGAARREVAVGRHLSAWGAPVVLPLDEGLAGPHVVDGCVITLWPYVNHTPVSGRGDTEKAAEGLRAIHEALCQYDGDLPPYADTLDRCWRVLGNASASPDLTYEDRTFLQERYWQLRAQVEDADKRNVPLHGDAHMGNVIATRRGPLWVDFESACTGPIEWDVAGLPAQTWSIFDAAEPRLTELCSQLRSVCVAVWCWADFSRSAEVREAAQFHLQHQRRLASTIRP